MPYYKQELPKDIRYIIWKEKWFGLIKKFVSVFKKEREENNLPDNKQK